MESRRRLLGSSDLEISPVGIGTAPLGSSPEWLINWGRQDENEAIAAIRAAIDEGVNWIDTAPFYGWGRAEEIVGKAIAGQRDVVHVFTKCGTMNDGSGGDFMTDCLAAFPHRSNRGHRGSPFRGGGSRRSGGRPLDPVR